MSASARRRTSTRRITIECANYDSGKIEIIDATTSANTNSTQGGHAWGLAAEDGRGVAPAAIGSSVRSRSAAAPVR